MSILAFVITSTVFAAHAKTWNLDTGAPVAPLTFASSADGSLYAVVVGPKETLELRDGSTAALRGRRVLETTGAWPAFSPDGKTLAIADGRGLVGLWDLVTDTWRAFAFDAQTLACAGRLVEHGSTPAFSWSGDNRRVAMVVDCGDDSAWVGLYSPAGFLRSHVLPDAGAPLLTWDPGWELQVVDRKGVGHRFDAGNGDPMPDDPWPITEPVALSRQPDGLHQVMAAARGALFLLDQGSRSRVAQAGVTFSGPNGLPPCVHTSRIVWDPSGKRISMICTQPAGAPSLLLLWTLDVGSPGWILVRDPWKGVDFDPSGQHIVLYDGPSGPIVIAADDGRVEGPLFTGGASPAWFRLSPDRHTVWTEGGAAPWSLPMPYTPPSGTQITRGRWRTAGDQILVDLEGKLHRVDPSGLVPLVADPRSFTWDGSAFLQGSLRVDLESKKIARSAGLASGTMIQLIASPDQRHLAAVVETPGDPASRRLIVWSSQGGRPLYGQPLASIVDGLTWLDDDRLLVETRKGPDPLLLVLSVPDGRIVPDALPSGLVMHLGEAGPRLERPDGAWVDLAVVRNDQGFHMLAIASNGAVQGDDAARSILVRPTDPGLLGPLERCTGAARVDLLARLMEGRGLE